MNTQTSLMKKNNILKIKNLIAKKNKKKRIIMKYKLKLKYL